MHSINSTTTCRKTYCIIIFMRWRPGSFWIEESHQKHSLMPIHRPNLMIHILVLVCFHVGSCDFICLVSPEIFLAGTFVQVEQRQTLHLLLVFQSHHESDWYLWLFIKRLHIFGLQNWIPSMSFNCVWNPRVNSCLCNDKFGMNNYTHH